jgi:hypothetical protein
MLTLYIDPNITGTGISLQAISQRYEDLQHIDIYPDFDRLFQSLRRHRLQFQRYTGECAVHPRQSSAERRHDYAPPGDVHLGYWRHYYQNYYIARPGHRHGWWRSDGHYRQLCFRPTVVEFPGRPDWCLSHDWHHGEEWIGIDQGWRNHQHRGAGQRAD